MIVGMSKIIDRGAEAVLRKDKWDGLDCLVKDRVEKEYRIGKLDRKLRKSRTRQEGKLLTEARRSGVPTPQIYEKGKNSIKMEFLSGQKIRDLLPNLSNNERDDLARDMGEKIGRLHERGIVHGDLTTSNMIFYDGEVYFIDFGLGYFSDSIEDQAVDLHLLYEVLISTHFSFSESFWKEAVQAYRDEYGNSEKVLERVEEIKKRGRYVDR